MVFDGRKLSPFDEELLADLQQAQAVALEPDAPGSSGSRGPGRPRRDRQIGAVVMAAFVVLVIVAGAVVARSGGGGGGTTDVLPSPDPDPGVAEQQVLAALGQTTAMGTMHLDYRLSESFGAAPPASQCSQPSFGNPVVVIPDTGGHLSPSDQANVDALRQQLTGSGSEVCSSSQVAPVTVTGAGTLTLDPKSMIVSADISDGLQVSVQLQGDRVWESGGAGYGMVSNSGPNGSGQPLSGFASLVEGTLGPRAGALAMTLMASPNAYLALEQPTVTGATEAGTGTVDGVPVTNYSVDIDLHELVHSAGLSPDETTVIHDALAVLDRESYHGTVATVSVDADGLIRKVVSVTSFDDGGTVTHEATYSDFSCTGPCPTTTTTSGPAPTTPPASTEPSSTTTSSTDGSAPSTTPTSVGADTTVDPSLDPSTTTTATP